jgi:hypothetical protein
MKVSRQMFVMIVCFAAGLLNAGAQEGLPDARVLPDPEEPSGGGQSGSITLSKISSEPNKITDEDVWWQRNRLTKPALYLRYPAMSHGKIPESAPKSYKGQPLVAVWQGATRKFFAYGEQIYRARYLLAEAEGGEKIEHAFDAEAYGTVAWAEIDGGTLYLSNTPGNLSAAKDGGARVFAIDLGNNSLKWSSPEKTCHGQFAVIAGSLVCGYGFTGEPDFIYVLDRFSGDLIQTIKLKTAADWLIKKGDRLHVRCYNTDEIYQIEIRD